MSSSYFEKEEQKKRLKKWAIAIAGLLVFVYWQYSEYKERNAVLEYNAKVNKQFLEIKKDFKFLKEHVKSFESSRWEEAVSNVQDMTQVLGEDIKEFDRILQQSPLSDRRNESHNNDD